MRQHQWTLSSCQPWRCKPLPSPLSLPNADPMHRRTTNNTSAQHSVVCSWMKLLSASRACFRLSWLTSSPSCDISSSPILMSPSIRDRPGRSDFAPFQRALSVCLNEGASASMSGSTSLLSWRTVRAFSTLRNILQAQHQQCTRLGGIGRLAYLCVNWISCSHSYATLVKLLPRATTSRNMNKLSSILIFDDSCDATCSMIQSDNSKKVF
jgi:hypothetical protein